LTLIFDLDKRRIDMENTRKKLAVVVMTVVLLVGLALGSVAPGVAGAVQATDGLHGILAEPMHGGGSGT
jgi:hypothetical protein